MISQEQFNAMSSEEHIAWLDGLNPVDSLIVHAPIGWRYALVFISLTKHLLEQNITAKDRLRFLEWLDKIRDGRLTPEVISVVEPIRGEGYELLREIQKLPSEKMLDACAKLDVFSAFAVLNPSLLLAIKIMSGQRT